MSDYDIVVKLDPAQAATGAAKVTEAVATTEAQGKKAAAAYDALGETFKRVAKYQAQLAAEAAALKVAGDNLVGSWQGVAKAMRAEALTNTSKAFNGLTEAIRREQAVLEQIHGPAKRYEEHLQTLDSLLKREKISTEQYANEVRKLNQAVDASGPKLDKIGEGVGKLNFKQAASGAAAAMNVLNEKLHLTETAFGRSVVEAGKLASVGAQIAGPWGAGIGAAVSVLGDLGNALGITISKSGKLGKAFDELIEKQRKVSAAVAEATKIIDTQGNALLDYIQHASGVNRVTHSMAEGFRGLASAAASLPDWLTRVGLGADPWDPAGSKWRIETGINGLGDLSRAGAGGTTREAILQGQLHQRAPRPYVPPMNGLSPLDFSTSLTDEQRRAKAMHDYRGLGERADGGTGPFAIDVTEQYELMGIAQAQLEKNNEQVVLLAQNTKKWTDELKAADTVLLAVADGIKQAGASFVDTLVDGAFGADVSWKKWGEDMLKMFAKLILQASLLKAIGSPTGGVGGTATGLYKLLGFASGGIIGPRGGGAADTETAMFRVAPRETIRIHTPEQERAYQGGGGSGATVNVVNTPVDDRALLQALSSPQGSQTLMNTVRQNRRAIKALLDG